MKVVIIGGGIAGLTLGIFLRKKNIPVTICERAEEMANRGHAFLMHTDGLSILSSLAAGTGYQLPGIKTNEFIFKRPNGNEIKKLHLDSWRCIKRNDLISFLYSLFPAEDIKGEREFSHFLYEGDRPVAAVFINGAVEYGDIFIGADGRNSRVRELLFGKVKFTPVRVKELVGMCPVNAHQDPATFIKFQNRETGLAFGMIPVSDTQQVWFMQYDSYISDVADNTPAAMKAFSEELTRKFPPEVKEALQANDFSTSYIWYTTDFDLLPAFHKGNVALIGDAAHVALPFTSAGTTNAILDAKAVALYLENAQDCEAAFTKYYQLRAEDIAEHINLGRELKDKFLFPEDEDDTNMPVPLIAHKENVRSIQRSKPVQVQYFTDPICSTCWVLQPLLRKLEIEYGSYINIEYHMGGMLPSWEHYPKGRIKEPLDAAKHWDEVALQHDMPLDGDVWIEDPLHSSFPPSIAFKAAQMQSPVKAKAFQRRLQEMVFFEKKNITKQEYIEMAALQTGLDAERLLRDIDLRAVEAFNDDLQLATQYNVTTFPTLLFSNSENDRFTLRGFHPYERFEEIIHKLVPGAEQQRIDTSPQALFSYFPSMTTKEFTMLSNITKQESLHILTALLDEGLVQQYESKGGVIWNSRFPRK